MSPIDLTFVPDDELETELKGTGLTLSNLSGWYISAHRWAVAHGYGSGMPTFLWDRAPGQTNLNRYRWKTACLSSGYSVLIDVPESELLGQIATMTSGLDVLAGRHAAAHRWARTKGYVSGFPLHECSVKDGISNTKILCLEHSVADVNEAQEADLRQWMFPFFEFETSNGRQAAAYYWATTRGYAMGYPTYEEADQRGIIRFPTVCLKNT